MKNREEAKLYRWLRIGIVIMVAVFVLMAIAVTCYLAVSIIKLMQESPGDVLWIPFTPLF